MAELVAGALDGRCLCGAVAVRVNGLHDPRMGACHCRMCQRWTGGVFLGFSAVAGAVTVTGETRSFRSSPFSERGFCPRCGSHLWFREVHEDGRPGDYGLAPGLFDAARDWPLRSEIYADRRLACLDLAGDHRRASRAEYEAKNLHIEGDDP
ncbi:GFA family protein [Rubellimicrobium sp. CFH 75288]|uniref:GFA family protein n=1 Tax=Rubellimicrobium sp. CFH 75288 TaxID=2697034 RepID=UPI0014136028|nr:GFA family protein [Rubellimicrobium sp. CFH 75288]NAZ37718.1 GFA family protein [Rubellimicrobium sp. CFH 75288]